MWFIKDLNKSFHDNQPRNIVKSDPKKAHDILNNISLYLINISILLEPFLPDTSDKIMKLYNLNNYDYNYNDVGHIKLLDNHIQKIDWYIFEKIPDEKIQNELLKLLNKTNS